MIGSIWFRRPLGIAFDISWPSGWRTVSRLVDVKGARKVYERLIETLMGNVTSKVMYGIVPSDPALQRTTEYFIKTEKDYAIYKAYLEVFIRGAEPNIREVTEAHKTIGAQRGK